MKLSERIRAYDDAMDDAANKGRNARPPTGDDYNELLQMVMTELPRLEAAEELLNIRGKRDEDAHFILSLLKTSDQVRGDGDRFSADQIVEAANRLAICHGLIQPGQTLR